MPLPPRYGLVPMAVVRLHMPIKLKMTYFTLYWLAWNHDYRYITESLEELAKIFDEIEDKPVSFNVMRRRMKALETYGLVERKRIGLRYKTTLLIRHDDAAPKLPTISVEQELEQDLVRGTTRRISAVDRFAYSVLDQLGCDYARQYSPEGCPFWFDIHVPQADLLIELDSAYWHGKEKATETDRRKDAWAMAHDYQLVRLQVDEIRDKSERTRLREELTELIQDELGPAAEQRGGQYVPPLQRTAPINNTVVVETDSEKEKLDQQQQNSIKRGDVERNEELLAEMGVVGGVRYRLATETWVTPDYLEAIREYKASEAAKGNDLGPGWVVKFVGEGNEAPEVASALDHDPDRYITGKYKDYIKR